MKIRTNIFAVISECSMYGLERVLWFFSIYKKAHHLIELYFNITLSWTAWSFIIFYQNIYMKYNAKI